MYKISPFTGKFDDAGSTTWQGILATAPSSPQEGWMYLNSTDDTIYVYYANDWWVVSVMTDPNQGRYMGFGAFTYG